MSDDPGVEIVARKLFQQQDVDGGATAWEQSEFKDEWRNDARAILDALDAAEGWRPIDDDTPLNCSLMLGWWNYVGGRQATWRTEYDWAGKANSYPGTEVSDGWRHGRATHWLPSLRLPAPPC